MNHYAPYGAVWGEQGTAQTPFGFTGEPTDQNSLVHLRARYYNPILGMFISPDPLEGSLMQPQSLNRYPYVQNNPANWLDPSGLTTCNQQPSPQNSFVCFNPFNPDPSEANRVEYARRALAEYGVKLAVQSPACGGVTSAWDECNPGCWTARNAEIVLASVRAQAARISSIGGNFRNFLPSGETTMVMSAFDDPTDYAALTPTPNLSDGNKYPAGPARIIIWKNGTETWGDRKTVIFSPELITHEFGHVISNAWNPSGSTLASQFASYFYGKGSPDFYGPNTGIGESVWLPFSSGSPLMADPRAFGRIYGIRYRFQPDHPNYDPHEKPENQRRDDAEVMPEAYAVWVYNYYRYGYVGDPQAEQYINLQIALQQEFWHKVFSNQIPR